ncbi:MAG: efflux RND transporter permease subunit [Burkholderiaceae bacterium]
MTKVSINNPVFATMVMVALVVLGIASYQRLGVEQLPDISAPVFTVTVNYPGASPEAIENDITKPIENAVNTISGIKKIRSNSWEGISQSYIEFQLDANVSKATQDLRDRVAQVRASFPKDAKEPVINRQDQENEQPVVSLSVRSLAGPSPRTLRDLTTLTDQVIVKDLQKAPGVGRIAYAGGTSRQIQIQIDPRRMASYGVGIDQVMDAIRQANQDVPAGLISNARNETLVRVEGKIKDIADFGRIIVARRGGNVGISSLGSSGIGDAPVYLSQVATIVDGEQEAQSIGRNDGQPALSLQVFKIQDANIVETGEAVKLAVANLTKRLPPGVEIRELYANSDWVKRSLDGVKKTLLEGGLLTVLIVFLFLRSWRSTIITGLTLPIAVMSTFIVLNAFHFTLNFMTMMALSLCIGLLIDDAIVVRENIVRHLHMGKSHRQAAEDGTNEIGLAVMATTFAIVAVFIPVAFMSGIIGKFFFAFGITVTAAVLVSLFVSFTLDPMLSSLWHDPAEKSRLLRFWPLRVVLDGFEYFVQWMHRVYGRLLAWTFSGRVYRPWFPSVLALIKPVLLALYYPLSWLLFAGPQIPSRRTLLRNAISPRSMFRRATITGRGIVLWTAFASLVAAFGLLASGKIGSEFIPDVDQSWISLRLTTPPGVSLEYADQKSRQVEAAIADLTEVIATDVSVFGEDRTSVRIQLKLKPRDQRARSQKEIEQIIRDRVASIPGVSLSIGFNQAVFVAILGPDVAKLDEMTGEFAAQVAKIRGIVDLETSLKPGTPALSIRPNGDVASDLGLTVQRIGNALRPLVAGETAGYWLASDGQNYEINVQMPKSGRTIASDIGDLLLTTGKTMTDSNGMTVPQLVPLRQVATISQSESPQVIKRQDLQRRQAVYANVQGRPAGDVGKDVQKLVDERQKTLPPGYRFDVGGQQQSQDESAAAAGGALLLAIVFIYLILASQFASLLQPVAIMAALPFSLIGVLLALLLTGTTLNLFSIIGFIMLMGLVTKNAILLVDFANQRQREGLSRTDALLEAGQVRLRPILMTTAAMVFGMLPLAIGLGEGSEQQAPMGRAIIGGVLTSTLLTLVVVPVIYSYLDRWEKLAKTWFSGGAARRAAREAREAEAAERKRGRIAGGATPGAHGAVVGSDPQARDEG